MIWTYWTPDQRRVAVQLGHDTIMGTCKVQKENLSDDEFKARARLRAEYKRFGIRPYLLDGCLCW